jgi:hypothetical protein
MRKKLGRLLPWVVTVGILAYLSRTISLSETVSKFKMAAPWTLPVLAVLVLGVYLADSFAIWRTFGWFVARLSFREVLVVRGATYVLALVNYVVGQGAIVYFVKRSRGVPVVRSSSTVLLIMGIHILILLLLTTLGLFLAPDLPASLRNLVLGAHVALLAYAVLLVIRPRFLITRPILDVCFSAGLSGHLRAIAVRLPHTVSLVLFTFASLRAFDVRVPIEQAVLYLPIVYFIAVLPISAMGLGTTQAAMIHFFATYAPGTQAQQRETVFAASLASQAIALVVQVGIAVVCMRSQLARELPTAADVSAG